MPNLANATLGKLNTNGLKIGLCDTQDRTITGGCVGLNETLYNWNLVYYWKLESVTLLDHICVT